MTYHKNTKNKTLTEDKFHYSPVIPIVLQGILLLYCNSSPTYKAIISIEDFFFSFWEIDD